MFQRRHSADMTPSEVAALYLAADEARWLAEDHGLSSYWEVARILSDALPKPIADSMDYCWAHAGVLVQEIEGDTGYYRRLMCHTAFLREAYPEVHEAIALLVEKVRMARACALAA
jgi:hypothetical protein